MTATLSAAGLLSYNVRRLLAKSEMTEAAFAKAIGLGGASYKAATKLRFEYLGEHPRWPKPERLDAMAKALGVPRSELFREVETP
jgi:transcriptional regulator with XRE-family HTH domain